MPTKLDLNEKRYIRESAQEQRISAILDPVALDMGYRLVRVRIDHGSGCTLQVMAENVHGEFTIEDCTLFSNEISPLLDVDNPIDRHYQLEVSSPGIDRPLVRESDFEQWVGHEAKIELACEIDGRRRCRGIIDSVENGMIQVRLPDVPKGASATYAFNFEHLASAKLMMTDKLLDEARIKQQTTNPLDRTDIEIMVEPSRKTEQPTDGVDEDATTSHSGV